MKAVVYSLYVRTKDLADLEDTLSKWDYSEHTIIINRIKLDMTLCIECVIPEKFKDEFIYMMKTKYDKKIVYLEK